MKRVPSLIIAIRGAYAPRYWYVAPAGLRYFRDLAVAWLKFVTQALRFCEPHRNLPAAIEITLASNEIRFAVEIEPRCGSMKTSEFACKSLVL